jgi:hypothetical protein
MQIWAHDLPTASGTRVYPRGDAVAVVMPKVSGSGALRVDGDCHRLPTLGALMRMPGLRLAIPGESGREDQFLVQLKPYGVI